MTELESWRDQARPALAQLPAGLFQKLLRVPDGVAGAIPEYIGPYRVMAECGRGGMGVVFEAIDEPLNRRVAVKVMADGRWADAKARARFLREMRAASQLRHDHLVGVYAAESPAEAPPYLVMPFIEGPTLSTAIAAEGGLQPGRAADICRQVADALAAVHLAGFIHRDVKPGNVILDQADGRAKLTDFGLVRDAEAEAATTAGTIAGTANYLSPEQTRDQEKVDARSDVYSLGATLYECLAGVPPFRGNPLEVLRMVAETEPIPPGRLRAGIPRELETICLKCLSKNPSERYDSAASLGDDLRRWLAGEPIRAKPVGPFRTLWKWSRRNRGRAALIAGLAASLLAGIVVSLSLWRRAEAQADLARSQKAEAERNLEAALAVVDRFCTRVAQEELLNAPGMQLVRRKLLEDAVGHYRGFIASRRGDPSAGRDVANALGRLAQVALDLGEFSDAIELRKEALGIASKLADGGLLAAGQSLRLSEALMRAGRNAEAIEAARRAETAYKALSEADSRNESLVCRHAEALLRVGQPSMFADPSTSLAVFGEAVALLDALQPSFPGNTEAQSLLADVLQSRATVSMTAKDRPDLERCLALRLAVSKLRQDSRDAAVAVATSHMNLGVLDKWAGKPEEATRAYSSAVAVLEPLVDSNPGVAAWRRSLARALFNRALVLEGTSKEEARREFDRSGVHFQILLRQSPSDRTARLDLAFNMVWAHLSAPAESISSLAELERTLLPLLEEHHLNPRDLDRLRAVLELHAKALAHHGSKPSPAFTSIADSFKDRTGQ